jgi:hypothetical protein
MDVDALAKLFDPVTKQVPRAIYVRARSEATLSDVAPGIYRIRFAVGEEWDPAAHDFRRDARYSAFARSLNFEEQESQRGVTYSTFKLTLHGVRGGTERISAIDRARFRDPP